DLAVGDDDPVAVAAGPPGGDDDPVAGRADRSSAGHAEVHAGVQLLRAGDRVGPVAEGGGRRIALGRVGQDSVAEVELALLLLLLLPFAALLRQPVLLFLLLGQLLLGLGLVVGDRLLRLVLRRDQVVEVIGLLLGIGLGGFLGQHRLGGFVLEVGDLLGHAREPLLVVLIQRPLLGEAVDRALLGPHCRIHSADAAVGARAFGH